MADITRYDCNQARSGDLGKAVDGYFEFALDHFINFFLRMEVLVNRRPARKIVVRERHVLRVEISSVPVWRALNHRKAACFQKWHKRPCQNTLIENQCAAQEAKAPGPTCPILELPSARAILPT